MLIRTPNSTKKKSFSSLAFIDSKPEGEGTGGGRGRVEWERWEHSVLQAGPHITSILESTIFKVSQ